MKKLIAMIAAAVAASATLPAATINLANVTSNTTLHDGDVVTGTLGRSYKIDITDGATVTLRDVTIDYPGTLSTLWAGITCNGNATIILEGANTVKGFCDYAAGISVAYTKTLTIQGTGSLTAIGCTSAAGIGAGPFSCGNIIINGGTITATGGRNGAGIGGGDRLTCGDITINGGTIVATGGSNGAGIGSGDTGIGAESHELSWCDDIAINGGSVTATGGVNAAGIGCGRGAGCDSIYIGSDITRVVAVKVSEGAQHIGRSASAESYYIPITIDTSLTDVTSDDGMTRTISHDAPPPSPWNGNLATLTDSVTIDRNMTVYGTLAGNYKVSIADGTTVTLSNAVINGVNDNRYLWAGITCEGDATIVLKGDNSVVGFYQSYAGIAASTNMSKTLTFQGNGSLTASSNGSGPGIGAINVNKIVFNGGNITAVGGTYCPGIGAKYTCLSVVISNGTIHATGGMYAAGIGIGYNGEGCGIEIYGGEVYASGGKWAAGIGGGYHGTFATEVTIGAEITRVVATCGESYDVPIGPGKDVQDFDESFVLVASELVDDEGVPTRTIVPRWNGNLAELTDNVTIDRNMTVYGTIAGNYKVSVADGATVTLNNATIIGENEVAYDWAGITCLGDATIVLNGANTLTGFYEDYPGIYVPEGKTLTIRGSGSLAASSNGYGAGIGGGYELDCGNIVIEGGTITATGGKRAAGIGGGYDASCGDISFGAGITRVVATSGAGCDNPIGAGIDGTSGTVTVAGSLSDLTFGHKRVIAAATVADDLTFANGDVATGRVVGKFRISIADGATVTISNLVVNGVNSTDCAWAGLTCLGDATVILKGENSVRGFHEDYPGLYVPENKTLTIRGSGSLAASSNGYGAGIGGGSWIDCGSIVIAEGTVTATGGAHAAGIGGGDRSACGDITITGGTVVATGGSSGAGIGGGDAGAGSSSCGDITIGPGITSVTATSNVNPVGAGRGDGATCGEIDISDELRSVDDGLGTVTITPQVIHLDTLAEDLTAVDGDILTGTLGENCMVSVANGATVTLRDAAIIGENDGIYDWAGLTCLGDATIILEGENAVKGFYEDYPGIYVPANKTLTIRGGGSLAASSNGYGAGIGGGHWINCGNIVIEGGAITADGGGSAAGIGCGYDASCGDITVSGGTIVANGGANAAGIGCGWIGSCGDISFGAGITRVTATAGDDCDNPIGAGLDGESGDVVLAAGLNDNTSGSTRTIEPWPIIDLASVTVDTTIPDGYMVVGSHSGTNKITIADGATVVLHDVSINPDGHNYASTPWAGITCLGDATIILDGENAVKGCNEYWPGIYVPSGSTLTIQGDGALAAAGSGFYGAGIGGGFGQYGKGGSIVIDGGVITATGGAFGAGIGSSGSNDGMDNTASSCMYITINGGIVTATGGAGAAGIGGGNDSDFWGITINGGVVTAAGGAGAAGIGGGCCYANGGYGDDILIAGGTVTATGGANAAGIGTGENGYCISITIGPKITRVVATCGEGCENPIGAGVDGDCENEPDVASSLSDETSVDGRTRVLARQTISGYDAWAEENGLTGAWDATDANGIHNVFRYAFDKPTGVFTIIGIEFNDAGKAVVVTPPLVNGEGFALSILATDRCDGEGAAATSYPLDPSGKTTIDETVSGSRFFRLKAQEE